VLKLKEQSSLQNNLLTIKTSLFDIPTELFQGGFNGFVLADQSTVSFVDFGKQRDNFEFIK